jgi:hypothetical protein
MITIIAMYFVGKYEMDVIGMLLSTVVAISYYG